MDDILVDYKLAEVLERIRATDDDELSLETVDAIIDSNEIDLAMFSEFAAELGSEERQTAQELIAAIERRLRERGRHSEVPGTTLSESTTRRVSGTVKWFNTAKGFGFIEVADRATDVFVHYKTLEAAGFTDLRAGQHVEFDLLEADDGGLSVQKLESSD